jgi:hypothetical protein
MIGGGKMLLSISSQLSFRKEDLKMYPKVYEWWEMNVPLLATFGISESDIESMLNGYFSIQLGSNATVMGMKVPGGFITLTGREGAAAGIIERLMSNPLITESNPLVPLKVDNWDKLYTVNQDLVPLPILFGAMKDTLFLGFLDSQELGNKPEIVPEVAKILETPLFGVGVINTGEIWNLIRQEVANPNSLLMMVPDFEKVRAILSEILVADLSVPLIKIWNKELDASFMEFSIVDVPEEKQLLTRIIKFAEMFKK